MDADEVLRDLTKDERIRLIGWPHVGSTFSGAPDVIASSLVAKGIGVMMPWKHGCQMGLTTKGDPSGITIHTRLIEDLNNG